MLKSSLVGLVGWIDENEDEGEFFPTLIAVQRTKIKRNFHSSLVHFSSMMIGDQFVFSADYPAASIHLQDLLIDSIQSSIQYNRFERKKNIC